MIEFLCVIGVLGVCVLVILCLPEKKED